MSEKTFNVWVTKYALSKGVELVEVYPSHTSSMVCDASNPHLNYHGEGNNWHRTEAAARARAEQMRKAKILSLEKQIKKLRGLYFGGDQ